MPKERARILASLTSKGFVEKQGNRDHDFLFFSHKGLVQAVFTKLSRGTQYKTIGDPLLAKMARQLRVPRRDFDNLIDCPMSAEEYLERLRAQGLVSPG